MNTNREHQTTAGQESDAYEGVLFEEEPDAVTRQRATAADNIEQTALPNSIRTPGRSWTAYPDGSFPTPEEPVSPEIDAAGEVEVLVNDEAVHEIDPAWRHHGNRFTALNQRDLTTVVLIRASGEATVQIHVEADSVAHVRLLVSAEREAQLDCTVTLSGMTDVMTTLEELHVGENAHLTYQMIQQASAGVSYAQRRASVNDDGSLTHISGIFGPEFARERFETKLKGDNAHLDTYNCWFATDDQHIDVTSRAQHTGQHTECNMISRGAADDNGSLVYEGLQDVGDNAADTSSFQHENTILLSDEAKANAAPKLMIDNSNVEATHAASSGAVDTDTMYYLNSRGIPTATAKRLIVRGFFQPVYDAASSNVEEIIVGEVKAKFESDTDV